MNQGPVCHLIWVYTGIESGTLGHKRLPIDDILEQSSNKIIQNEMSV